MTDLSDGFKLWAAGHAKDSGLTAVECGDMASRVTRMSGWVFVYVEGAAALCEL